jgi:CPA1 family monovalent cation:H+ antiporter
VLQLRDFQLTPELILALLVPPLIYEAAFHLNIDALRRNLVTILAFAILGVVVTTFLVAVVVSWGTEISFSAAILFGTLVAATDPVAVIALFRSIGVPKRLQVILEGESLLNDGTAIVLFTLALDLIPRGEFNLVSSLIEFLRVSGGGLAVGLLLGYLISLVFRRIDEPLIETTLTLVLAYGAYLVAESISLSGVLAVVAAGLVSGNIGPQRMSPTSRILVFNFWEIAAFLANSFIFLLIGLEIDLNVLFQNWQAILVALLAVLTARAVVIFGLSWTGRDIPNNWRAVLYWGGLRGAISLALALSLPTSLGPIRDQLEAMAFGVVLFTLLFQGITMEQLVRRMKVTKRSDIRERYERRNARLIAARAAYQRVNQMHRDGIISDHIWESLSPILEQHNQKLVESVSELMHANPTVEQEELNTARREALQAQRSSLTNLFIDGIISDEIFTELVTEVDAILEEPENRWYDLIMAKEAMPAVNCMAAAIVQERDFERATRALRENGFSVTRLPSSGGFLGRRNATLLVGFATGQEAKVVGALEASSRRRVEFVINPLVGWRIPIAFPRRVPVGGATIFVFDVEEYREF